MHFVSHYDQLFMHGQNIERKKDMKNDSRVTTYIYIWKITTTKYVAGSAEVRSDFYLKFSMNSVRTNLAIRKNVIFIKIPVSTASV